MQQHYYSFGGALLLVAALAVISAAMDNKDQPGRLGKSAVKWNNTYYNKTVSGVADGVVFVTSLNYGFGEFSAKIEALDAATGLTLWSNESIGKREIPLRLYSFSSVPKVVFFLQRNTDPTQLLAFHSRNGSLMWSLTDSTLDQGAQLQPSPDGSVLFLISTAWADTIVIDRTSGANLQRVERRSLSPPFPVLCGATRSACLAMLYSMSFTNGTSVDEVRVLDARTGHYFALTLARFGVYYSSLWGVGDVLVISNRNDRTAQRLNTTSMAVLWTISTTFAESFPFFNNSGLVVDFTNSTTGKPAQAYVPPVTSFGEATTIDLETGVRLPSATAGMCPRDPPAPSASGGLRKMTLTPFGSGRVAGTIQCQYYYPTTMSKARGTQLVYIYAVFDVTNMTLPRWWRYTSESSANEFLVVDSSYFLLVNQHESGTVSTADLYNSATLTPKTQFSWTSLPSLGETSNSQPLAGWTTNGLVVLQQYLVSPPGSFHLVSIQP